MIYQKYIFATTHLDSQNEMLTLNALESMVEQINQYYIPVGNGHDPRKPPIGRVKEARVVKLKDNEYAVEGIVEIFETNEDYKYNEKDNKSIPIHDLKLNDINIGYSINFLNDEDLKIIKEINKLFKSTQEPRYYTMKTIDPIGILVIGGLFILGTVSTGFFSKLGSDLFDLLKEKLKKLLVKKENNDKLLKFEFNIEKDGYIISAEIILTNPNEKDIDYMLKEGIKELDKILPKYFLPEYGLKKLVFEYNNKNIIFKFGIRKDAVPLSIDINKIE